jgi:CheY-like chemotaxis protein
MTTATTAHKRILLIDDNFLTRETLSLTLTAEGYMVAAAGNGADALERLAACEKIDVILLDLAMPVMNGSQFRQLQLQEKSLADIPVIVFSASEQRTAADDAIKAFAWLQKPVATSDLLKVLNRCAATP